jgi:hypothetical protein
MSMRKLLATSAAMSLLAVQFLCDPHQRALANPFTCQEVPEQLTSAKPAAWLFSHVETSVVHLFIRGLDNRIYQNHSRGSDPTQWTGWSEVEGDGLTLSAPAVVDENRLAAQIFVRSYEDRIYQNKLDGTGWSEVPGNGLTLSSPAAVIDQNGILRLFVRGLNNRVYEIHANNPFQPNWSAWSEIEGEGLTISEPTAIVYNHQLFLFVRGYDNRIYLNKLDGAGWSEVPGAGLTIGGISGLIDPSLHFPNFTLRLFMTGVDHGVWENDLTGNSWSGWFEVSGGAFTPSGPAALDAGPLNGRAFNIYVQTEDGRIVGCGL